MKVLVKIRVTPHIQWVLISQSVRCYSNFEPVSGVPRENDKNAATQRLTKAG
jgi:hypothetical protein